MIRICELVKPRRADDLPRICWFRHCEPIYLLNVQTLRKLIVSISISGMIQPNSISIKRLSVRPGQFRSGGISKALDRWHVYSTTSGFKRPHCHCEAYHG